MSEVFALVESTPAEPAATCWVRVALDVPLPGPFDYRHTAPVSYTHLTLPTSDLV